MADVYSDPAWDRAIAERDAEIARLKAEVERLTAALKGIDDCGVHGVVGLAVLKTKARAALTPYTGED